MMRRWTDPYNGMSLEDRILDFADGCGTGETNVITISLGKPSNAATCGCPIRGV